MDYLTQRFDMVAERILENERLTADLDDAAAQALLDWGLSSARLIVDGTVGIEDEEEADEAMYPGLRANSRLMRTVNKWVAERENMDELASLEEFGKVRYYAATVYAETFTAPSEAEWQPFIFSYQAYNDVEMIVKLRNLFDSSGPSLPADEPAQVDEPATEEAASAQPPADEPAEASQPATEAPKSPQPPADEPTEASQPATEAPASAQPPAASSQKIGVNATQTSEVLETSEVFAQRPIIKQIPPADEPVQTEASQPATEEAASAQPPADELTEASQPATEAPASPPPPAASSQKIGVNATQTSEVLETSEVFAQRPIIKQIPPAGEPATEEPATEAPAEEPASPQPPAGEPAEVDEPAVEETPSSQPPAQEPAQTGKPTAEEPTVDNGSKQNVLLGQVPTNKGSSATDADVQDRDSKSFVKRVWGWVTSWFS